MGQMGWWQWPVSEFEAASPPPSPPPPAPTPPCSSPSLEAAKAQRGCLQGVHLCTSVHFLLQTCTQRYTHKQTMRNQFTSDKTAVLTLKILVPRITHIKKRLRIHAVCWRYCLINETEMGLSMEDQRTVQCNERALRDNKVSNARRPTAHWRLNC